MRNITRGLLLASMIFGLGCGMDMPTGQIRSAKITRARTPFEQLEAHPPIRVLSMLLSKTPSGMTPFLLRKAYNLPDSGGSGTIAIIDAFDAPKAEDDLNVFSSEFGLPECTTANGCFLKHLLDPTTVPDINWSLEVALDTQWAHAVAPDAKILLVVARSNQYLDMIDAIDYARMQPDVVAVSMSWGGAEMIDEIEYDKHFTSDHGVVFFASSGDGGIGTIWPSVSPSVVSVGGTSISIMLDGTFLDERAWRFSGGGISHFEPMPDYQVKYGLANNLPVKGDDSLSPNSSGTESLPTGDVPKPMRATPDVSLHANNSPGYAIYFSYYGTPGWMQVGGTSGGTPCWAAIQALGLSVTHENLYKVAHTNDYRNVFRDITAGYNGNCGSYCSAKNGFDFATGLGSPLVTDFTSP